MPNQYAKVEVARRKDGAVIVAIRKKFIIKTMILYPDGSTEDDTMTQGDMNPPDGPAMKLQDWGKNLKLLWQRKFLIKPKE